MTALRGWFCGVFPFAWGFCAHSSSQPSSRLSLLRTPTFQSARLRQTLSVCLKILLIYYMFVHVWVLGSFVLETIPHLAILLQRVVRYPEVCSHIQPWPQNYGAFSFPDGGDPHLLGPPNVWRLYWRKGSFWWQDLPLQNWCHQTHCMQHISVCNTKSILITNQPKKIRDFNRSHKKRLYEPLDRDLIIY